MSLRRKPDDLNRNEQFIAREMDHLIAEGRVRLIGLIRQEVLSGVRLANQFEKLRSLLRPFPDEPLDESDYEAAAQVSNRCQSRGITVSVVDALICSVAMAREWTIFTTDTDFEHHARIVAIKLHVPRK